jgi:hypothetical protein
MLSILPNVTSLVAQNALNKGISLQPAVTSLSAVADRTMRITPSSLPPSTILQGASFTQFATIAAGYCSQIGRLVRAGGRLCSEEGLLKQVQNALSLGRREICHLYPQAL